MGRPYSHDRRADRKTGGAGARTHPLSDEDYRREMNKLASLNAADDEYLEEDDDA